MECEHWSNMYLPELVGVVAEQLLFVAEAHLRAFKGHFSLARVEQSKERSWVVLTKHWEKIHEMWLTHCSHPV